MVNYSAGGLLLAAVIAVMPFVAARFSCDRVFGSY